jgi:C-terminal peptidase prc
MLLLLVLLACSPPDPAEIAAQVLAGDVDGAAQRSGAAGPLAAELAAWAAARSQLAALTDAERVLLADAADQALNAGEPIAAAPSVLAGMESDPAAFAERAERLAAMADAHPDVLAALADTARDPEVAAAWRTRAAAVAHQVSVASRYGPEAMAVTRARQAGVTPPLAGWMLDQVDTSYVTAPDHTALAAAAAARLSALAAAWPRDPPALPSVTDRASLDAHLAAAVAAWPDVPAELVVAEWTEAAFGALDRWSQPVWPADLTGWEAHHAGVSFDMGLSLALEDGMVRVDDLAAASPAWQQGVHVGDAVIRAGTVELSELPEAERADAVFAALTGAEGDVVPVTLFRQGAAVPWVPWMATLRPYQVELVTGARRTADNGWDPWLAPGVAYVRLAAFRPWTTDAFDDLLADALDAIEVVVIDLRGNGGGDVQAAVDLVDRFVADGKIAGVDGRDLAFLAPAVDPETGEPIPAWNDAVPGHALEGTPVIVLADGETASAAELCAGGLQQRAGATVIGARTYGKGRSQRLIAGNGAALQLTNLRWALPDGTVLDGTGITPDVALPLGPAARYAISARRVSAERLVAHADGTPIPAREPDLRPDLPQLSADPAVARALLVAAALQTEALGD